MHPIETDRSAAYRFQARYSRFADRQPGPDALSGLSGASGAEFIEAIPDTLRLPQDLVEDPDSEQSAFPASVRDHETAFSMLGFTLGILPAAAVLYRFFEDSAASSWVFLLTIPAIGITAATGLITGRFIGRVVLALDHVSALLVALLMPLIGLWWGLVSGVAGGSVFFLFGALPGGLAGAGAGSLALMLFYPLFHLIGARVITDRRRLFPLTLGLSGAIAAAILGLPGF